MNKLILATTLALCLNGPATAGDSLSQQATNNLQGYAKLVVRYGRACTAELKRNAPPDELLGCMAYAEAMKEFNESIPVIQQLIENDRSRNGTAAVQSDGSIEEAARMMEEITPLIHRYVERNQ